MATVVPVEVERDYGDRSSAPPHAHRQCEPPPEEREPAEGGHRSKESRAGPGIQIERAGEYDRPGHEEPSSGAHRRHGPSGDRPGDDEQRQGVIHLIPNAGLKRGEEIGPDVSMLKILSTETFQAIALPFSAEQVQEKLAAFFQKRV